ncbi:hypothetical protein [Capillimicrobium parvum]|uniref:DUF1844 domain-containing protein n=1 Tax=Capillimicrobium parvum TaxID=2884022 RepID=A0A9E6XZX7_9ACTN|nr:hypothetical protein [Capillimicrobium parvum]UGS37405.1 hypothetical protein DSM104329_03821 [Capillimicrobium parvum]
MSEQDPGRQPTEEELRAAYEAELKRVTVDDVVVQTIVSLVNLGGRKAGLAPGTEDERDLDQVRLAIEAVRATLPLVEAQLGPDADRIRDALSQLQMAYAQQLGGRPGGAPSAPEGGGEGGPGAEEKPGDQPGGPGPAQASGRLWVPGQ